MRYLLGFLFCVCLANPIISKDIESIERSTFLTIYFQFNSTNYIDSLSEVRYKEECIEIKEIMDANLWIDLGINGYQNTLERANLSKERAEKVKQELIKAGVSKDRLIVKQQSPIVLTDSILAQGRWVTQRVKYSVEKRGE